MNDVPSEAETLTGERSIPVHYEQGRFEGSRYWLPILVGRAEPDAELLAEGYREQADEALWFAEASLSAQAEALPEDAD
jgi:hypothetical protein